MSAAHSLLGASAAHRWLHCPGSFRLSQVAPHRPASRYAAAGTAAHALIERAAENGLALIDASEIGKTWHVDGYSGAVDQPFIDGINVMLKYLNETPADVVVIEHPVSLDRYVPDPPVPIFGTTDAILVSWKARTLEIVDFKNGAGVAVSPAWNPQLLFYAAGALAVWPQIRDWTRIRLTVVQPNVPGEPIRSWDLALIDLFMWIDEVLIPGVEACTAPDAPLNAGEWCRFCPVSQSCPLLHEAAQAAAKAEFDAIPETSDLAQALETAERAELWINAIREFALDQLQRQVKIPGWEMVPTRATRKWLLPDDDIAARLRDLGADAQQIWETRLRSPAQAEKALQRTRAGKKIWQEASDELVEKRSSGFKVGRSGSTAQEDFDALC